MLISKVQKGLDDASGPTNRLSIPFSLEREREPLSKQIGPRRVPPGWLQESDRRSMIPWLPHLRQSPGCSCATPVPCFCCRFCVAFVPGIQSSPQHNIPRAWLLSQFLITQQRRGNPEQRNDNCLPVLLCLLVC